MLGKFGKYRAPNRWLRGFGRKSFQVPRSPYFDADWYLAHYEDVKAAGVEPWKHFLKHGARELRQPSPYFDTKFYASQHPEALDLASSQLDHYEKYGMLSGATPSVYFDPNWYSSQLDGKVVGDDLLLHYLTEGWQQGISPSPYFDVKWYLSVNIDVASIGIEPLRHYVEFGHGEGRQPNPYFDVKYYISSNEDVAKAGFEPLKHYISYGWREAGRLPNPYFDKDWYRRKYMDQTQTNQDPFRHFITEGVAKNLQTSPSFDREFYLEQSPEIGNDDNAFRHFITVGQEVGRRPNRSSPKSDLNNVLSWARANSFRLSTVERFRDNLELKISPRAPERAIAASLGRLLGRVDAVSFDIFDTLVERRSGTPDSVFEMVAEAAPSLGYVGGSFSAHRKEAESIARRNAGHQEVQLSEIYSEFAVITGAEESVCSALQKAEIEKEIAVCEAKEVGKILFDMAVSSGKAILLVTDIYLPQVTVETIIRNCGYDKPLTLFVSSRLGATKHYGHLYEHIKAKTGLAADRIVHIGDNPHSDGEMARAAGLRTLLVPKARMVDADKPNTIASKTDNIWSRIVRADRALEMSRAELRRSIPNGEADLSFVGSYILGPILLDYAIFLAKKSLSSGYDRLFFASRDAFYLKEAYDLVRKSVTTLPESQYFYASRKVCRFAMLESAADIKAIADVDHFPMAVKNFLISRFMLDPSGSDDPRLDHIVEASANDKILASVLSSYQDEIISAAAAHRKAYLIYLNSIGLDDGNNAIVDVGYRGTIQRSITKLTGRPISGAYVMVWPEAERLLCDGLRFDAFIRSEQNRSDILNRNLPVFELLLSGTHASVSTFSLENGTPVARLMKLDTVASTRAGLNELRRAALQYVSQMCDRLTINLLSASSEPQMSMSALRNMLRMPSPALVQALQEHVVEDDFGGETRPLMVRPKEGLSFNDALKQSSWKEGTASLWRSQRYGYNVDPQQNSAVDFFDGHISRAAFR